MKVSKKIKVRGPISEKTLRAAHNAKSQKIIDIKAIREAKAYSEQLEHNQKQEDFSEFDGLHALYIDAQHRIAEFIEQFSCLPYCNKLNSLYDEAEDIYMPGGPPMSPITRSYFTCWTAFDMKVGVKKETYTTVMIDVHKEFGGQPEFIKVLENMQNSYMGLYLNEGHDEQFVYLKELYTNKKFKIISPSKYMGVPGEIWYVRLFSDPFGLLDYSVAFTTPYVIIDTTNRCFYPENNWNSFIVQNMNKTNLKDQNKAYYNFMKYGLSKHYWLEYVFLSYANHREDAIWSTGYPDKPETLPHSPKFEGVSPWENI